MASAKAEKIAGGQSASVAKKEALDKAPGSASADKKEAQAKAPASKHGGLGPAKGEQKPRESRRKASVGKKK